jgi:hypothetical protein
MKQWPCRAAAGAWFMCGPKQFLSENTLSAVRIASTQQARLPVFFGRQQSHLKNAVLM